MRRRTRSVAGIDLSLTGAAIVVIDAVRWADAPGDWRAIDYTSRVGYKLEKKATPQQKAERLDVIATEVIGTLRRFGVENGSAFVEDYSFAAPYGAHQLGEIGGVVRLGAHRIGCTLRPVNHASARKVLLGVGTGKGIKEATHSALERAGYGEMLRTGDELDAFVVANFGLSELGLPALMLTPQNVLSQPRRRR
jgi:hypothetical protein